MWKYIQNVFFEGINPKQQRSILVLLAILAFIVHLFHVYGALPFNDGFVSGTDVETIAEKVAEITAEETKEETLNYVEFVEESIKESITELHAEILVERLENLQIQKCGTIDKRLRNQYSSRISRNMAKYRELKGFNYRITECEDM